MDRKQALPQTNRNITPHSKSPHWVWTSALGWGCSSVVLVSMLESLGLTPSTTKGNKVAAKCEKSEKSNHQITQQIKAGTPSLVLMEVTKPQRGLINYNWKLTLTTVWRRPVRGIEYRVLNSTAFYLFIWDRGVFVQPRLSWTGCSPAWTCFVDQGWNQN